MIPARTTSAGKQGRPRKPLAPDLAARIPTLDEAGSEFIQAQTEYEEARLFLISIIRDAILAGMHYIDAGNAAGVSRAMAYHVHRDLVKEGHEINLR